MSKFTLNSSKENIFLVGHSEIERRLDPNPYHSDRIDAIEKLKKVTTQKLKYVVSSKKVQTKHINKNDIYIGLENIISNTGEYIATKDKNSISSANIFKKGQILFPKLRPYLNKVYLAEFNGLCSTEFHVFTAKEISADYLSIYLKSNLVVNQTKHLMTGNTLPRLQTEDINNIPVPVPSKEVQETIVKIYNRAFQAKQQKEQEAKALLDSVSEYLLGELGIELPEKDYSHNSRIFTTSFSELSSNRFDCDYYMVYYQNLIGAIENTGFKTELLDNVCHLVTNGKTPAKSDYSEEPTQYPIIKVGSYSNDYIDLDKVDYSQSTNSTPSEKGDIFILSAAHQAEYVGRHIKYLKDEPALPTSFVGELICVRANENKCNSMFLFSLLNTELFKSLLNREKTGQTSHIYGKDIKSIKIPAPPISKQIEIADHIAALHLQSSTLNYEAKQLIEQVRLEIEQIILGE